MEPEVRRIMQEQAFIVAGWCAASLCKGEGGLRDKVTNWYLKQEKRIMLSHQFRQV